MSYYLIDDVTDLVRLDGLPRVSRAKDDAGAESLHVVYLDGTAVRSMLAVDWPPPLPIDPTPEQSAAAIAAREAAQQQAEQGALALRQAIRARLSTLAGKRVDDLLVGDLKTLLLYVVWREGGIDKDLKVRPIAEWIG